MQQSGSWPRKLEAHINTFTLRMHARTSYKHYIIIHGSWLLQTYFGKTGVPWYSLHFHHRLPLFSLYFYSAAQLAIIIFGRTHHSRCSLVCNKLKLFGYVPNFEFTVHHIFCICKSITYGTTRVSENKILEAFSIIVHWNNLLHLLHAYIAWWWDFTSFYAKTYHQCRKQNGPVVFEHSSLFLAVRTRDLCNKRVIQVGK